MYIRKYFIFRNAIEVEEHAEGLFGAPGLRRRKKAAPTAEQMQRHNQYVKTTRCRRKLREYFRANDYMVTLTYRKDLRPANMDQAKEDLRRFLRLLRGFYKKRGKQLRWIANIEVGTRGAWHVHLVVNRIQDADLAIRKAWQHGRVSFQLLYEQGEFRDLAAYMTKTPLTDKRLREACYKCARGMEIPEPKQTRALRKFREVDELQDEVPAGWYIDRESYFEGVNPVTQMPYRAFTMLRIRADKEAEI